MLDKIPESKAKWWCAEGPPCKVCPLPHTQEVWLRRGKHGGKTHAMGMEELVGIPSAFPVKMKKTQRVGGKMGGLCWSRKGQVQEYIEE